jgi:hypothetical protein
MTYPGLFKRAYPSLKGRDWLKTIKETDPENLAVFVSIGDEAHGHGKKGGRALVEQKGREYMSRIGYRGAVATNIKRAIIKQAREEIGKEFNIEF